MESGLGGSAQKDAHGASEEARGEARLNSFIKRGEEILDTFSQSIRSFEAQTLQFKTLEKTVSSLQEKIGEKRPAAELLEIYSIQTKQTELSRG